MIIHDDHHHRIAFPTSSPSHSASSPESDKITLHRQIDQCASDEGGKTKSLQTFGKTESWQSFRKSKDFATWFDIQIDRHVQRGGGD